MAEESNRRGIVKEYILWLLKLCTLVVMFVAIVPALFFAVSGAAKQVSSEAIMPGEDVVSVIEISGVITDSKDTLKDLYKEIKRPEVKGVVLRVDSPGGAVGPSQEIYQAISELKKEKPIVVSMGTVAASGGLYVSLGASKILAQPGTITGSIGVILQIPNFTKIAQMVGVDMLTVKSGELKDVGNSFRPVEEHEREFLKSTVLEAHSQFVKAVVDGRNLEEKQVRTFADGRIILGSQAKELNLIDGYGDVVQAARTVYELLEQPLPEGTNPKLHYTEDKFSKFKELLESITSILPLVKRESQLNYLM